MMRHTVTVPVKKLDKGLDLPAYAYAGDAGLDLRAAEDVVLRPFERKAVSCGIALAIPEGHAGLVLPRSGLALKHGITVANSPGLIDSNYRGEIKAILANMDAREEFQVVRGDRIAQLVIIEVPCTNLAEVDDLDDTVRGDGGFGSSGVRAQEGDLSE